METLAPDQLEALKYPTGKFARGTKAETPERVAACIAVIEAFPLKLRAEVQGLNDAQLDTPYRPDGWTVRQVVHHLADSHGHAPTRFKLALTEATPVIKPYKEALWAELPDGRSMPLEPSVQIITGLHARWGVIVRNMTASDFERAYFHPEQNRAIMLGEALELYVWHSGHHLAHITRLKERMQW
ncbi:MAG: putative metal-dependent hydrolase [Flavobacteriales bacterium]|nr:putative metal-dependent hydrolase [Flavobacteriales bacterium]